jgi:HEAT repeat protein
MRAFILGAALAAVAGLGYARAGSTLLKKEEIPRAILTLERGSAKDRASAAEALGQRGAVRSSDVKAAVAPLRELLRNDRDVNVRKAAAEALGNIGLQLDDTIPALLDAVKADKAEAVKVAAIDALGRIGPEARAALPELRRIAGEKKKDKRLSRAARMAVKAINAR